MKATSVHICIFTNKPPNAGGAYSPETLGAPESGMYAAASAAAVNLYAQEGLEGTTLSMCNANAPEFRDFLTQAKTAPPFIAIAGTFGNVQKFYIAAPAQVETYLKAMWLGEFSGTSLPTNLGGGGGGWGQGDSALCKILPPLCALGFLPWLALSVYTTYRAAESRSTVGRAMWGVPAFLFWQGFLARGGVKQIQYWVKKVGIGSLASQFTNAKTTRGTLDTLQAFIRANFNQMEPETRMFWVTVRDILNGELIKPASKRQSMAQIMASAYNIEEIMKKHGAQGFSFETI